MVRWNRYVNFEEAACDILRSAYDVGINTDSVRTCFASVSLPLDSCSMDGVEQVLCEGES